MLVPLKSTILFLFFEENIILIGDILNTENWIFYGLRYE